MKNTMDENYQIILDKIKRRQRRVVYPWISFALAACVFVFVLSLNLLRVSPNVVGDDYIIWNNFNKSSNVMSDVCAAREEIDISKYLPWFSSVNMPKGDRKEWYLLGCTSEAPLEPRHYEVAIQDDEKFISIAISGKNRGPSDKWCFNGGNIDFESYKHSKVRGQEVNLMTIDDERYANFKAHDMWIYVLTYGYYEEEFMELVYEFLE